MEKLKPDASAVYVPGDGASKAIMDAIEAEVPLIVAVAEHVPIHDILKVGPDHFPAFPELTVADSSNARYYFQNPTRRCKLCGYNQYSRQMSTWFHASPRL